MKKPERKIIKNGIGFTVYMSNGRYFVDLHKPIIHSYSTLEGVAETLYYNEYIEDKTLEALLNA